MIDLLREALRFEIELGGPLVALPDPSPPPAPIVPAAARVQTLTTAPVSTPDLRALIPPESPVVSIPSLEELERYVAESILIPLDATRLNPVFGVGNPEADFMVIGEAPGADEDEQGEPFVGRAGQLLDKIVQAIGFARSEIYIANILKSRPPNNRNPLAEEIAAHEPILYRQIELIRPKLILCVGRIAATTLLRREDSLKNLRQQFHDFHGIPLAATYHPAALLRNPNWKRPTWEDVQMVRARFDELVSTS